MRQAPTDEPVRAHLAGIDPSGSDIDDVRGVRWTPRLCRKQLGAVALLLVATVALVGEPRTPGLCSWIARRRRVWRFGKAIIFPAAAIAIIAAHNWFERGMSIAPNICADPVQRVGMAVMVSATGLVTAHVGLELQSLRPRPASYRRSDERSVEAGLNFVLGALASSILSMAFRCSTVSPGQ